MVAAAWLFCAHHSILSLALSSNNIARSSNDTRPLALLMGKRQQQRRRAAARMASHSSTSSSESAKPPRTKRLPASFSPDHRHELHRLLTSGCIHDSVRLIITTMKPESTMGMANGSGECPLPVYLCLMGARAVLQVLWTLEFLQRPHFDMRFESIDSANGPTSLTCLMAAMLGGESTVYWLLNTVGVSHAEHGVVDGVEMLPEDMPRYLPMPPAANAATAAEYLKLRSQPPPAAYLS